MDDENRISRRMRLARSISFKIDVCNYLVKSNGNVSATAKHFNIYRKQVRYYKRKHQLYVAFSNKVQKKNMVHQDTARCRAKYFVQEQLLYSWIIESREKGKNNFSQ